MLCSQSSAADFFESPSQPMSGRHVRASSSRPLRNDLLLCHPYRQRGSWTTALCSLLEAPPLKSQTHRPPSD